MYRKIPTEYTSAMRRNELVVSLAEEVVAPDVAPESSVRRLLAECHKAVRVIKS